MALPDLQGLLETARRLQSEVARVRDELGNKTVTGETGGGLVRCVANGKGEVLSITFDPAILAASPSEARTGDARTGDATRTGEATSTGEARLIDAKMIEDLTVGAVNLALERA